MPLKLESFSNAVARLEESLRRCEQEPEDAQLRDGLIQRFEFTYEVAFNLLRRCVERSASSEEAVKNLDFSEIIRQGWDLGLLHEEVSAWRSFRQRRNIMSHTYNEANAITVCAEIPRFLAEAKFLLSQLEKRNDDDPLN